MTMSIQSANMQVASREYPYKRHMFLDQPTHHDYISASTSPDSMLCLSAHTPSVEHMSVESRCLLFCTQAQTNSVLAEVASAHLVQSRSTHSWCCSRPSTNLCRSASFNASIAAQHSQLIGHMCSSRRCYERAAIQHDQAAVAQERCSLQPQSSAGHSPPG